MLQDSREPGSASKALVFHPVSFPPSYGFLVIAADDSADTPSENEFFTPHLVDSIHRVQLCQNKKKSHSSASPSSFACGSQRENPAPLGCHLFPLHCLSHGALGGGAFHL